MPKKTLGIAAKAGAIFITQVKENQPSLLEQITHCTKSDKPYSTYHEPLEKGHGRVEERWYEAFDAEPMLKKWAEWQDVKSVIRVTRARSVRCRTQKRYKDSLETSYYVCTRKLSAATLGSAIRRHWFVENKLHYVKDVSFREDFTRKEQAPINFSILIDIALNILRLNNVKNIKGALYEISLNTIHSLLTFKGIAC